MTWRKHVSRVAPMWMKPDGCVAWWRKRVSRVAPTWMKQEGCVT